MSLYESLVNSAQMNFQRYPQFYGAGLVPYQLSEKDFGDYQARIERLAQEIEQADCIIVGGASGLSAAGGGDFYYDAPLSFRKYFRKYFGKFAKAYGFKGAFDGTGRHWEDRGAFWAYLSTFMNTTLNAPMREPYLYLDEILKDREFFILTTNQDTQFVKIYPDEKVAQIQGDHRYFQCAKPCCDEI